MAEKKKGFKKSIMIISIITLILIVCFPLIIWDALGNGAEHFMRYGNVNVAGVSDGSSRPTFFFGILYTIEHISTGFIPADLYSAQWRVIQNTTEASASASALGVISLIVVALLILVLICNIVVFFLENKNLDAIVRIYRLVAFVITAIAFVYFAFIAIALYSHVKPYGFRTWDFMAYGGIKTALEAGLAGVLAVLNALHVFKR